MAQIVNLLVDFSNGQGVGRPLYTNYPQDLDSNFISLQNTVNQLVDEGRATNTVNALLSQDTLLPSPTSSGRINPTAAQISFVQGTSSLTVSSGPIFVAGQRIDVTGQTFSSFTLPNTSFIAVGLDGLLTVESSPNQQAFDIANINQTTTSLQPGDVVDNLAVGQGRSLNGFGAVNRIYERSNPSGSLTGLDEPVIAAAALDGSLEDAGFVHLGRPSRIALMSRKEDGEGVGAPVIARTYSELGQSLWHEQARVIATSSAGVIGDNGVLSDHVFNAAERIEPSSYFTDPWISVPGSQFIQPGADVIERFNFLGTYSFSGYANFADVGTTGPFLVRVTAAGQIVFDARVAKVAGGVTTVPIAGMFELPDDAANTITVSLAHSGPPGGSADVRFGFFMQGAGADRGI